MANDNVPARHWSSRTLEIKVWKLLVALAALPVLVMWYRVVHQDDEILALVRNEVIEGTAGQRTWTGAFVNTNDRTLREVGVIVDFLDARNQRVARTEARAEELRFGARLDLQAALPAEALRLRIHSVQWRMDLTTADRWLRGTSSAVLLGPFREPWEFGYRMVDAPAFDPER